MGALMRKAIGVAAFASLTVAGLISSIAATGINKEQSVSGGYRSDGAAGDKAGTREEDSI